MVTLTVIDYFLCTEIPTSEQLIVAIVAFMSGQSTNAVHLSAVNVSFNHTKYDKTYVLTLKPVQMDKDVIRVIQ